VSATIPESARSGEVWLVDFGEPIGREQAGRHPAVVFSADPANASSDGGIVVVPVTTARREKPSHVEIEPGDSGLDQLSYARCEDASSIPDERLVARRGTVDPTVLFEIAQMLRMLANLGSRHSLATVPSWPPDRGLSDAG
jgi:mRNA interferase MazF